MFKSVGCTLGILWSYMYPNSIILKEGFNRLKLQEKERLIDYKFFSSLTQNILKKNHEINSFELKMMESMHTLNDIRTNYELFQIAIKNKLSSDKNF